MSPMGRLAVVGAGPSAVYLLKHLLQEIDQLAPVLTEVYVFEKRAALGVGMPYDRQTTDVYNLCNISSAEIPPLDRTLVDWLHALPDDQLAVQGISRPDIDADETYRRTTLGDYFHAQYSAIAAELRSRGLTVCEFSNCTVHDVVDLGDDDGVEVRFGMDERLIVDRVVIATGHAFHEPDEPALGYFASPWPMHKLLPGDGDYHDFEIGTLGASLSAFDVVSSLAHRHGSFAPSNGTLVYEPFPGAEHFRLVLHSAEGWLPHLQYEQSQPFRAIYRHTDREQMLALRDAEGFLPLDAYFDQVCRPALTTAFQRDKRADIVQLLAAEDTSVETFIGRMSDEHTSDDPFALMRLEMKEANRSLRKGIPIHWKETLDDLMYTLNFHFDLLSAEDHRRYRRVIMPFLMNVIAAMPLHSASILLALHDAGRLDLVTGRVSITDKQDGCVRVAIENGDDVREHAYRMFINCSGQGNLGFDAYPFPSMTANGTATEAVAYFRGDTPEEHIDESNRADIVQRGARMSLRSGGVAIDGYYRMVGDDGASNARIHDIAFPHTTGVRPYSYGLQACDAAASIVIQSWCAEQDTGRPLSARASVVTKTYEDVVEP